MTTFELPEVGEPEWDGTSRTVVKVDDFTYGNSEWLEPVILDVAASLARMLAVQEFIADEAEAARFDCAGERAYTAFFADGHVPHALWDRAEETTRMVWTRAARAVLDGE